GIYRELFAAPRHIVFLSAVEQRLVHGLFDNAHIPWTLAGAGVEQPTTAASRYEFRRRHGLWHDILLYVGRVDENKGVHILLHHFEHYQRTFAAPIQLVLAGRQTMDLRGVRNVVPLGFVEETEKAAAFASATAFAMPSRFESFSIV